ncbi:MAG: hypothetical protein F6K11_11710 [Leptolyngbya sp. SIO3F4]|nr:hypothetical protein [Leptolyngbya sp. SIO3F4]
MAKLTADDRMYKQSVRDRIACGANFRKLRYGANELKLKPNMDAIGERNQGSRSEPIGIFFETYQTYIGKFAIKEQNLPKAAFSLGAVWQMMVDDGLFSESWENTFVLKQPKNTGLWYELELAKFIAEANLTVTYTIPTGTYTVIGGNSVPDTTSTTFTAVVNQQQQGELVEDDGLPAVSRLYLEGYMVNPQTTPADASTGRLMPATLTNPTGTLEGEFISIATAQPAAIGATAGSGEFIKGLFLLTGDDRS